MLSVALVGPDGAGKSTICRMLADADLPAPMHSIYMGVNLEASGLMLPTTRLILALKRARGGRPDLTGAGAPAGTPARWSGNPVRRAVWAGLWGVRFVLWLAEEWFRQAVALYHRLRGRIVVFDRHFYTDYYHDDVVGVQRPLAARLHGVLLRKAYPKPDLVICLDAPGDVLFQRKPEASPEWLEGRRRQYLALATVLPDFVVVDVDRPLELVTADIAEIITTFWRKRRECES